MLNIDQAVQHLNTGGILIYPTETVYGIGCLPSKTQALNQLLEIKKRQRQFILIADDWQRFNHWVDESMPLSHLNTPKPTTFIVKAATHVPDTLKNLQQEIAIRKIKEHAISRLLKQLEEPLISTSANLPGEATPTTTEGLMKVFSYPILNGKPGGQSPSRIIHFQSGQIIRP
ncbi:L-threonylcarbamoyladenylate synthase [Candidatus Synchoanobacter obligatus]|uniref:L-threonylcarbamoyladenylate synthase n=1 Tax=Candidatus Synchoanobacter obligatus TaxID=2919597 RepID=A0ABT1L4E3_9GAMM|nr:Sua5/YciO/YrdC/YwlC family protein [Candidatus Synchoanobacter obligatus]MCP8352044.1 Sua5/YciO/YrdC/YwlC family protein [Candidatus Synchoanobacter obligatus]